MFAVLNWMHDNLKWIISNNNAKYQFFWWIYFFSFPEKKNRSSNWYLPNSLEYDAESYIGMELLKYLQNERF